MAENTKTEQEKTIQYAGDGLLADEEVVNTAVQQDVEAPENASTYKENKVNFMDFFAQVEEYLENDGKERVAEKTEEIGGEGQQGTRYRLTDGLHFVAGKNAEGQKYYQFDSYLNHSTMDISDDGVKTTYSDHKDAELPLDLDVEGWDLSSLDELIEYYDYKRYISPDIVSSLRGLKHEMDLAQEKTEKMEENQKNYTNYFNEIGDICKYIDGREGVETNWSPSGWGGGTKSYTLENGLAIKAFYHIGHDSFDLEEGESSLRLNWEQGEFRIGCRNGDKSYSTSVKYDENLELPDSLKTFIEQMEEQGYLSKGLVEKAKDLIEQTQEHQKAQKQQKRVETIKENKESFNNYFDILDEIPNIIDGKDGVTVEHSNLGEKDQSVYTFGEDKHLIVTRGEGEKSFEFYGNNSAATFDYKDGKCTMDFAKDGEPSYSTSLSYEENLMPKSLNDLIVKLEKEGKIDPELATLIGDLANEAEKTKEAEMTQEQPEVPEQEPEKEEPNLLPSAVKATEETRFGKIAEMAKNLFEKVKGFFKGKEGPAKEEQDHGDR